VGPTYRHWPFDTLIENGAATPDVSPNKTHVRLSGQELCEGVIGKALRFKAVGKGVVIGDLGLRALATLCFWLKTDRSQSDGRVLSQLEGSTFQSGTLRLTGEGLQVFNTQAWPIAVDGRPIMAHEGDIARSNGVFYWYGSSYADNPKGKFGIAVDPVWNGVLVHRSTDLKHWEYRGVCLPRPENGWGELGSTGRSHVIYNEKTKKYVMWYRWYLHVPASFLMVAVADHPEGPFTSLGPREMGTSNGFASDMNVFKNDDGKAHVIYCDHGEHGVQGGSSTYAIRIDSLSDDYLDTNKDGAQVFAKGCEAPAMIKHKCKYIAVASGVHGWAGSETKCATADSPLGTWAQQANVSERKTWSSQVTDLIYLEESDTVMALCDQWWIPDRSDINKSRYLFLPLYLDPATGKVRMEYIEKWNPLSR